MADAKQSSSLDDIRKQLDNLPKVTKDSPAADRRAFQEQADELSRQAGELRQKELENSKHDDEEKQILKLYNEGMQNYEIAKTVYKFVNQDTVGKVILTIRKEHADDWNQVEDINSTKGYTGV